MLSDADIIRLHARLRKTANAQVQDNIRGIVPSLLGAAVGMGVAKPGDEVTSALSGAIGAAAMKHHGNAGMALGAMTPPVALALYRHFTTPDPGEAPQQNGYPYPG
jgi:hypothetical protein